MHTPRSVESRAKRAPSSTRRGGSFERSWNGRHPRGPILGYDALREAFRPPLLSWLTQGVMPVRVQIAGVSSLEEALALERMGADALGFTVRLPGGIHDGLTEAKARSIIAVLPPFLACVAITYVDNARDAIDLCRGLGVAAIQLHGECPARELELLRAAAPHVKIIRVVHVTGEEALAGARRLERRVDALILDTYDAATGRGGATGKMHDWAISRRVVESVRVPVILAGGLRP